MTPKLAAHLIRFMTEPTSRTYILTYAAGQDLCRAYAAGDPERFRHCSPSRCACATCWRLDASGGRAAQPTPRAVGREQDVDVGRDDGIGVEVALPVGAAELDEAVVLSGDLDALRHGDEPERRGRDR